MLQALLIPVAACILVDGHFGDEESHVRLKVGATLVGYTLLYGTARWLNKWVVRKPIATE